MSATTASRSAFDRSERMQAIRMEIVANQYSVANSRARSPLRRERNHPSPASAPSFARELARNSGMNVNSKDRQGVRGPVVPDRADKPSAPGGSRFPLEGWQAAGPTRPTPAALLASQQKQLLLNPATWNQARPPRQV
jgi:hypothetical protein